MEKLVPSTNSTDMKEQNIQLSLVFAIRRFLINVRYPAIVIRKKKKAPFYGKN